jgi:FdhE protein
MTQDSIPHIDRLIQQRPASRTALAAFRELALLMAQAAPEVKPVQVEKEIRDLQQREGFPLFSREDLPLDFDAAADLLKKFLAHLSEAARDDSKGLRKAVKRAESADDWPGRLFRAILKQDEKVVAEMATEVNLDPNVLAFLGKTALRPSIERLREAASGDIDKTGWDKGYCPLCGSQPDMACFEKTGKRYLHCELCGEEWPYPRMQCPFCNTREQEKLGYFEAEEEEGLRVYFCRECLRYIKTIDKRVFEEAAPLELESLATIHLDLLAQENGFN